MPPLPRFLSLPPTPNRCPPGPQRCLAPSVSRACAGSLAPHRPPLSRHSPAICARRLGANAGRRAVPPPHSARAPLSLLHFPLHATLNPGPPCPLSSPPAPPSRDKRCRPPSHSLYSSHSLSPMLKHATTSPVLPRIGPSASDVRALASLPDLPREAAAIHPLSAPSHLPWSPPPFLPLYPWCRTRVTSSVTTVPALPPSNATAPPTHRYWGKLRL
jgi:hypothetical protein